MLRKKKKDELSYNIKGIPISFTWYSDVVFLCIHEQIRISKKWPTRLCSSKNTKEIQMSHTMDGRCRDQTGKAVPKPQVLCSPPQPTQVRDMTLQTRHSPLFKSPSL